MNPADRPDRPVLRRASQALGAVGLIGVGAIATSGRARRDLRVREAGWRDRLHHGVVPSLHAARRALDRGDVDGAVDQIDAATLGVRHSLAGPDPTVDAVGQAIAAARRTWPAHLHLDTSGLAPVPVGTAPAVRRALATIVQESLNNVARHQPGATARVALQTGAAEIVLSVAATTVTAPDDPPAVQDGSGYGLPAMRRAASDAGGHLRTHLDPAATLVLARFPIRRWPLLPTALLRAVLGPWMLAPGATGSGAAGSGAAGSGVTGPGVSGPGISTS